MASKLLDVAFGVHHYDELNRLGLTHKHYMFEK